MSKRDHAPALAEIATTIDEIESVTNETARSDIRRVDDQTVVKLAVNSSEAAAYFKLTGNDDTPFAFALVKPDESFSEIGFDTHRQLGFVIDNIEQFLISTA